MPVRLPEKFSPFSLREQLWRDFRSAYNDVKRVLDEITQFRDNVIKAVNGITPHLVRNVLINGDFNIWQAGTSFTGLTSTNHHVADMAVGNFGSHGTWTIERDTDVPSVALVGRKLNYSLKCTCTSADATVGNTDWAELQIRVEGYDYAPLFGQTQTLRFAIKSNRPGTYSVCLRNMDDHSIGFVHDIQIEQADTWELKSFEISGTPPGTWLLDNNGSLQIIFVLAGGADFQIATTDQWVDEASTILCSTNQENLADAVNNYIAVADVRLVPGTDAENIYIPSIAEQLAMCQRYFYVLSDSAAENYGGVTSPSGGNLASMVFGVPIMRATPTASLPDGNLEAFRGGSWGQEATTVAPMTQGVIVVRIEAGTNTGNMLCRFNGRRIFLDARL